MTEDIEELIEHGLDEKQLKKVLSKLYKAYNEKGMRDGGCGSSHLEGVLVAINIIERVMKEADHE